MKSANCVFTEPRLTVISSFCPWTSGTNVEKMNKILSCTPTHLPPSLQIQMPRHRPFPQDINTTECIHPLRISTIRASIRVTHLMAATPIIHPTDTPPHQPPTPHHPRQCTILMANQKNFPDSLARRQDSSPETSLAVSLLPLFVCRTILENGGYGSLHKTYL